jgi:hypothetical protein
MKFVFLFLRPVVTEVNLLVIGSSHVTANESGVGQRSGWAEKLMAEVESID